jgi:hypothetical protein
MLAIATDTTREQGPRERGGGERELGNIRFPVCSEKTGGEARAPRLFWF